MELAETSNWPYQIGKHKQEGGKINNVLDGVWMCGFFAQLCTAVRVGQVFQLDAKSKFVMG